MLPGSNQGQGPSNQTSALGMNSLHLGSGSPIMNRMEGGGIPGAERNTQFKIPATMLFVLK